MSSAAIFDRDLLLAFQRRALHKSVQGRDFLLLRAIDDLSERLSTVERRFPLAADISGYGEQLAHALIASGKVEQVIHTGRDASFMQQDNHGDTISALIADEEALPFHDASMDLIVSLLSLQGVNDLPGCLLQIRRALRPDGLFLAAFAGAGTFGELRESLLQAEIELTGGGSPRVFPFADVRDAGALLQRAGFSLPVTDVENITIRYSSIFDLMADIRAMGMQNVLFDRSRKPASRRLFIRAAEIYAERFADPDGRIRATISLIWLSGWAPHESQQKPLKPGSAKVALADALSKIELSPDE